MSKIENRKVSIGNKNRNYDKTIIHCPLSVSVEQVIDADVNDCYLDNISNGNPFFIRSYINFYISKQNRAQIEQSEYDHLSSAGTTIICNAITCPCRNDKGIIAWHIIDPAVDRRSLYHCVSS